MAWEGKKIPKSWQQLTIKGQWNRDAARKLAFIYPEVDHCAVNHQVSPSNMTSTLSRFFPAILLISPVIAQAYGSGDREEDAFSWVQPLNTTILGPYGHSPAVLPSRKISQYRYSITVLSLFES